eukprot:ANDGO_03670.mRNA.1 hypothetical protein
MILVMSAAISGLSAVAMSSSTPWFVYKRGTTTHTYTLEKQSTCVENVGCETHEYANMSEVPARAEAELQHVQGLARSGFALSLIGLVLVGISYKVLRELQARFQGLKMETWVLCFASFFLLAFFLLVAAWARFLSSFVHLVICATIPVASGPCEEFAFTGSETLGGVEETWGPSYGWILEVLASGLAIITVVLALVAFVMLENMGQQGKRGRVDGDREAEERTAAARARIIGEISSSRTTLQKSNAAAAPARLSARGGILPNQTNDG